jgi:hypothetical protein
MRTVRVTTFQFAFFRVNSRLVFCSAISAQICGDYFFLLSSGATGFIRGTLRRSS